MNEKGIGHVQKDSIVYYEFEDDEIANACTDSDGNLWCFTMIQFGEN